MNYMEQVAKMLGVELEEEFECSNGFNYRFTKLGLLNVNDAYKREEIYDRVLIGILTGGFTIKRKPWKPAEGELYYFITNDGTILYGTNDGATVDFVFFKIGNCYRTKEDAEANRDKWIEFYASDEVLEV